MLKPRYFLFILALALPCWAAPEDEKPRRPPRPRPEDMTFLNAGYWARVDWEDGSPKGNTYEDAKKAFALNSYYASQEVQRFQLSAEQQFEFALLAAEEKGAVFSGLVAKFHLLNEEQRFLAGIRAAECNTWANVDFKIEAFRLSERSKNIALMTAALLRRDHHLTQLAAWQRDFQLTRAELLRLLKHAAKKHGLYAFRMMLGLLPDASDAERLDLLLAASKKHGFDVSHDFQETWLPRQVDRIVLAKNLAATNRYFPEHLKRFAITSPAALTEIERLMVEVPGSRALWNIEAFRFSDAEWLSTYFALREREDMSKGRRGRPHFWESQDPVWLISRLGKFTFPKFRRPGESEKASFSMKIVAPGPEGGVVLWDSELAELERGDDPALPPKVENFAHEHPALLPETWVKLAFSAYPSHVMAAELLRQCYRLSKPGELFVPRDSLHVACAAAGLECPPRETLPEPQLKSLHIELLSLALHMPTPLFKGLKIAPELLSQQDLSLLLGFLRELRLRLYWETKNDSMDEWIHWQRLRSRLKLASRGMDAQNIGTLTNELMKRPPHSKGRPTLRCYERLEY